RIGSEQDHVHDQNQRSNANTEMPVVVGASKKHPLDRVIRENDDKKECQIKKVSMDVLQDQREFALAAVTRTRFANGACRRVCPERLVVSTAVVVARQAKSTGCPQNKQSGRDKQPFWDP